MVLRQPRFHVHREQRRGHGSSLKELAALRARTDADASRVVLLGGSIGGALAPILAAESPEGIAGVMAVGGFTRTWYEHMLDIERRRLTLAGRPPSAVNAAMRGLARLYTEYLVARRTPADVVAANPELRSLWDDEPRHQYGRPAAYYQAVQQLDVEGAWATLAERGIPALVVWGEYDWIMGRAEAERAVEIVNAIRPGTATLSILPRTGHGLMTFASQAATFAGESPRYDGLPGRVVVEWLRR
jgi:pimeloyl-ACP methyl ester carboxylesterase